MSYFTEHYNCVRYPDGQIEEKGLRRAQLGAIHAIASHFTLKDNPAVVIMPTGSGKTAVLMLSAFLLRATRVLVITPSRLVRAQIVEDFKILRTLTAANALEGIEVKPKVFELEQEISSENEWDELRQYDVIVSTPRSISPAINTIPDPPEDLFDLLLIDEAHHSPAKTWNVVLSSFPNAKKILFTATPFRRDRREIKGKFIYNYPISEAVKDEIFGNIEYIPIESNEEDGDKNIAQKAEEILNQDRVAGLNHYLMVRTDTKTRAKQLDLIYKQHTRLNLKVINSDHTYYHINRMIKKLRNKELDGIICVDMLGEGFDFPNLKVAAIHSPHKSLAVTLQFIGRFARTNANDIGDAKFIAVPSEIQIETSKLYDESAIWKQMITHLSESRVNEEIETREIIDNFECKLNIDDETKDLSLFSLTPYSHVKIFFVEGEFDIEAQIDLPEVTIVHKQINSELNAVVFITKEVKIPSWTNLDMFERIQYDLFIVFYDEASSLLFINATRKSDPIYEEIARKFTSSEPRRLSLSKINKVLVNVTNTEFFNIGMRNSVQTSVTESYRIITGANAQKAIKHSDGKLYHKGHCFGRGDEEGKPITIGYSSSSKVWSHATLKIPSLIKWCKLLARKILGDGIVKTFSAFDFLPESVEVHRIPNANVIAVDWDKDAYLNPPVVTLEYNDGPVRCPLFDYDLTIEFDNCTRDKIAFNMTSDLVDIPLEFKLGSGQYLTCSDPLASRISITTKGGHTSNLLAYLNSRPLTFYFEDFSSLVGNQYYQKLVEGVLPFDSEQIEVIDWNSNNVDIKSEYVIENNNSNNPKISIHEFLNNYLNNHGYDFLFYDHGSGEIADFLAVKSNDDEVRFTFYHCKAAKTNQTGDRVDYVYEVCGQAVKSVIWMDKKKILNKIRRRARVHANKNDGYRRDNIETLKNIIEQSTFKRTVFELVLVQPGISKNSLSEKVSNILAAANDYCINQGCEEIKLFASNENSLE